MATLKELGVKVGDEVRRERLRGAPIQMIVGHLKVLNPFVKKGASELYFLKPPRPHCPPGDTAVLTLNDVGVVTSYEIGKDGTNLSINQVLAEVFSDQFAGFKKA